MPMCKSKSPKDFGCTLQAGHVGPHQAWGSPTADRPCDEWSNVSDVQEIAYAKITTAPDNSVIFGLNDLINHPPHYGADIPDNPYETIKVVEAWNLNFHLGQVIKYISRAGKKGSYNQDLCKAQWYLNREIERSRD